MEVAKVLCVMAMSAGVTSLALAQAGIDEALRKASDSGYEAVLVVVVMAAFMGGMTWIVRTWFNQAFSREERMARRIDTLEEWQKSTLAELVKENTRVITALMEEWHQRPCLASEDRVRELRQRHEGGKI